MKIKYSKQYKVRLREDLLKQHEHLYGQKAWWKGLFKWRWASLAPVAILVLALQIVAGGPGFDAALFLREAHASTLQFLAKSQSMIVYESVTTEYEDGTTHFEERWTAPNGDTLILSHDGNDDRETELSLHSQEKAYMTPFGSDGIEFFQPSKDMENSLMEAIYGLSYGEEKGENYLEAQSFLNDINFFEVDDLLLWLESNLDGELVNYAGEEGDYHVFVLDEPELSEEFKKSKGEDTRGQSSYYFNSENYWLERIVHGTSVVYFEIELIEPKQYDVIFDPEAYNVEEVEYISI